MYIIILLVILVLILLKFLKTTKIKWGSFFHRGIKVNNKRYGVYIYDGKQGSGKTSSAIQFIRDNKDFGEIYANLKSIKGINYNYFNGLEALLSLRDKKHCIIFYDEIFTLLTKQSRITTEVLDFLSQMRKREIIFITTCQEWLELSMTLRRYCKYQIHCTILNLPFLPSFSFKQINNAELMKWSQEDNDYIAPLVCNTLSKLNRSTLNLYDTYEQINSTDIVYPIPIQQYLLDHKVN